MKRSIITVVFLQIFCVAYTQTINELQAAINDPLKKVQVIHHYPKDIKDGECHFVEVTNITLTGSELTIVEKWTNGYGSKSTTTLKGVVTNQKVNGTWESSFSSGKWSYDFTDRKGLWNKLRTMIRGTFPAWQNLEFIIVNNAEIRDGSFVCGQKHD
jgi:hypothetical protein